MPNAGPVWSIGIFLGGLALAEGAGAQPGPAPFCAAVGAYMHDVAARRAAGATQEEAVADVATSFDAFASDAEDLASRRRVLEASDSIATFAFDLADLAPTSVQRVGEAYCLARGGDMSLAPSPARAEQMAANARECEQRAAQSPAALGPCVAEAIDVREVRVARESVPEARGRSRIQPFYEFGISLGGDTVGTIVFVGGGQEDVNTGDGLSAGGGIIQHINSRFGIKYSAAYKVWPSTASNADVLKSVLPIDIVPYFRNAGHRFGVGVSHHLSPRVDWDWLLPTTKFDDATGVVIEYAFKRFSFSYTDIDYEAGAASLDAGHLSFKYSSRY